MFIYDRPIEKLEDDFLGRKKFSQQLGNALLDWKEKESLVIAIYGEWGSGKSSVINMALDSLGEIEESKLPCFIHFNPWAVSEEKSITKHFFNEIAFQLSLRKHQKSDKVLAKNLKYYAQMISLAPQETNVSAISTKILLILSLFGVTSSQLLGWFNLKTDTLQLILAIGGIFFLILELVKGYMVKLSSFFERRGELQATAISEMKNEIRNELFDREKKLVIIIDDIDRLNESEIRQVFRLIRVNADFPNTIYLLAFDRNIVEANLGVQIGVSGSSYLHKIVQVDFDIPFAKPDKIANFLFKEIDRILGKLPDSVHEYFGKGKSYWPNIYNSGFKNFFQNIRDVKRYASSLEFNFSQMHLNGVMEVNPIDFIALEGIRVFAPKFHAFMRGRSTLFTSHEEFKSPLSVENPRKTEIEEALLDVQKDLRGHLKALIKKLFPQLDNLLENGNMSYGAEWQSTWNSKLQICAEDKYDSYFTLSPGGGDEQELSQFEVEQILSDTADAQKLESSFKEYILNGKIKSVLDRFQDYMLDEEKLPTTNTQNVIQALFNVSDDLPKGDEGLFSFGLDMDVMRIVHHLLKRNQNKEQNYKILEATIKSSTGVYGPVHKISLESSREAKDGRKEDILVPEVHLKTLQALCVSKLQSAELLDLINHRELVYLLYRWKEWDAEKKWQGLVQFALQDDDRLLTFLDKFVSERKSYSAGEYAPRVRNVFDYKSLNVFTKDSIVLAKLQSMKKEKKALTETQEKTLNIFLENYDKRESQDDFD